MIMLPIMTYMFITKQYNFDFYIVALGVNSILHSCIDYMKCNDEMINYYIDQYCHMGQIAITWLVYYLITIF